MAGGKLKHELTISGDGSHTIKVPELNEHYHSRNGALRESAHVFIEMGLNQFEANKSIRVLEVGFGTGLNALLSALSIRLASVHYVALEPHPIDNAIVEKLNYPKLIKDDRATQFFQAIHAANWELECEIHEHFCLTKKKVKLEAFNSQNSFDMVYYDAFAPHAQPELWTQKVWTRLVRMMSVHGILVTYCAKGQVRRDLISAGFDVERLPGPPGKREMLRAKKPEKIL